jgi:hypothetical protein
MSIDISRLRELCAKGLDRVQIAERLGANREAVRKAIKRHGLSVVAVKGYESRAPYSAKNALPPIESSGSGNEHH